MKKKIVITIISLVSIVVNVPLSAQESCYERFLSEHNMRVLTAEDADDSYEELKKEVIARQRMHEEDLSMPIVLAIDTTTGTCQILAQDGTILADAYLAMVDSTWYMWLSVDPLADKSISNSPYMYCGGNPVMLIDPDGREVTITGDDGVTVTYLPSAQYDGNDAFVKEVWGKLDKMHTTKSGRIVLDDMVADKGEAFRICNNVSNGPSGVTTLSYTPGKRIFKMKGVENASVEQIAHEIFHGYQDINGYGGASCANDVEAYFYEALIESELNHHEPLFNNAGTPNDQANSLYKSIYLTAYYDGCPNIWNLNVLAFGFRENTKAGSMGVADNYTILSPNQKYLITNFWPR